MNKTDDWLALLLYAADLLMNPAPAKILAGYESWDYRRRFKRHLRHLEQRQLIQTSPPASARRIQLTDRGRLVALGGRDPFECWRRRWDGKWRIIMFDLPTGCQSARVRLIRWLRRCHFGYLQRSVWVHPDPMVQVRQALKEWADDAETMMVMEASCALGFSNAAIVVGAWDFTKINKGYQEYLSLADKAPPLKRKADSAEAAWVHWLRQERAGWLDAVSADPLLPEGLLPKGYLGQQAAAARQAVLARAGELFGR